MPCDVSKVKRIGEIVKNYHKPIIQALTNELTQYNMRLLTTKCLNCSVTFWYLFFGKRGLLDTNYCDVPQVVDRHETTKLDHNMAITRALRREMTAVSVDHQAFYIMFTDGYFVHPQTGDKVFFPGHVMVIEKAGLQNYYIYQCYINQYDFKGSLDFREKPEIPKKTILLYLDCLDHFASKMVWDNAMISFWKDLTNVDTSNMLGFVPSHAFYMCFRNKPIDRCLLNFRRFVDTILKKIPTGDDVYGRKQDYNAKINPLTNNEMRQAFTEMRSILSSN